MKIDITIRLFIHDESSAGSAEVLNMLRALTTQGETMAKTFADLQASVAKITDATTAVLAVLTTIAQKLKDCETVADFEAVTAELEADSKALTDAALANTPAAPPA